MASLPPRQQQSQRPPRRSAPSSSSSSALRAVSERHSPSSSYQSSEPVSLNEPHTQTQALASPASPKTQPHPAREPRSCWICYMDETEDKPGASEWVSPCKCSLVAHQDCLLEWVADLEAPQRGSSRELPQQKKIQCPQCQSEIILSRPRNRVVELAAAAESLMDSLTVPGIAFSLGAAIYLAAKQHGVHTIYMIFGPQDGTKILEDALRLDRYRSTRIFAPDWLRISPLQPLDVALPMIPLSLIISRTSWSNAILPVLPIFLLAASPEMAVEGGYLWPPSAALTIASLPYLQNIYREYMDYTWTPLEKKWMREVSPTHAIDNEAAEEEGLDGDNAVNFGLRVEIGEGNAANADAPAQENGQAARPNAAPQAARAGPPRHRREINIWLDVLLASRTAMGALLLPSISAAMGEVLALLLPKSWTTEKVIGYGLGRKTVATGLLQTRWGRSIVGGCLAVVLKDAIRIYCRWRLAKSIRDRRVLNYDKQSGATMRS